MTDAVVHLPVKLELMSRFHNRNFELLEPYDAKVSRTVLRGEGSSNAPDLLDIFLDNPAETFQQFEKRTRNLQSLSRYSRANQINKEWLDQFLNEGHSRGLTPVRCHCNVLAWSDDAEQLKRIKSDVGSQLATMECKPRHNTVDVPALFWAGIPGNESDFPAEESFYTYLEQALCFFVEETNYRDSPSPFGIKMVDRITGKPLHLDISDEPMKRGVICNRNRIVISGSGGGKSFFVNHLVRQYYEQGTHVVLVDVGNSYKGLCALINHRTGGQDGIYFTYTEDNPISFNPFFSDDNIYDVEKRESIKTLILTLWKRDNEPPRRSEEVALSNAVSLYIQQIQNRDDLRPSFDTFYEFIDKEYRGLLERKRVREKDFDIENFLNVLEPYYKGGEYDYLLNSQNNKNGTEHRPAEQTLYRVRTGQYQGSPDTVARYDADYHGVFYFQNATAARRSQTDRDRRMLESPDKRIYEPVHQVFIQNDSQIFRRNPRRNTRDRRYCFLADCKGGDHQQLRHENPAGHAQVHE